MRHQWSMVPDFMELLFWEEQTNKKETKKQTDNNKKNKLMQ